MERFLIRNPNPNDDDSSDCSQSTTSFFKKSTIRRYDKKYLGFGFISIIMNDIPRPQCVMCSQVLSNESMKPAHLARHLKTRHPSSSEKPLEYFIRKKDSLAGQKSCLLKSTLTNEKALRASFLLAIAIAKAKKPHSIAETLILPAAIDMCREMLGENMANQLKTIPVSNDTIQRRIASAAGDALQRHQQLILRLQDCKRFALQLDESTDVSSQAQLLAYVRYIWMDEVEEDFLFCKSLPGHTTSAEIYLLLNNYMSSNNIDWSWCVGVCTDGAAAMTGRKAGLWELVRANVPTATFTHCIIHRESLASKKMSENLKLIFNQAIKVVNFIKARLLNSRLFE